VILNTVTERARCGKSLASRCIWDKPIRRAGAWDDRQPALGLVRRSRITRRSVFGFLKRSKLFLGALSVLQSKPQWRIVLESIECLRRSLSESDQRRVQELIKRRKVTRSVGP